MAYTRIHPIKNSISGAINYIINPDKTEGKILVSTFACSIDTAARDFESTLAHSQRPGPNKAYHLIQSFVPGETTYEEAHKCGEELARKLLGGKYSYVVATHTDQHHLHNHIIFCATDNFEHQKYHDTLKSYYHICHLSNAICKEHNLSVITERKYVAKDYAEWAAERKGNSWKAKLKEDINETIRSSHTYEEFIRKMRAKGYEIDGEEIGDPHHKYISFRAPGQKRSTRGKDKTLGPDYTKERIKERIEEKAKERAAKMRIAFHPGRIIDTSSDPKYTDAPYLKRWADLHNLKAASAMYAEMQRMGFHSLSEMDEKIASLTEQSKSGREAVVALEKQMDPLAEMIHYGKQYQENKVYDMRYHKSKDKERYYRNHATELALFGSAQNVLQRAGYNPEKLDLQELQSEYDTMAADRARISREYKQADRDKARLEKIRNEFASYMSSEKEQELDRSKKRTRE